MVYFLKYYVLTFFVSFYDFCFEVYFVWCKYCYPSFLFMSICLGYVFHPFTFNLCRSFVLRWASCRQHIYGSCFLYIQLSYVFWLEHLIHLCLRLILIGTYSLPFFLYLCFSFSLSPLYSTFYGIPFSISCSAGLVEM